MRMIRPKLVAPQVMVAEDQEEYRTLTAAIVRHPEFGTRPVRIDRQRQISVVGSPETQVVEANGLVVAFRLTDEERAKIAAGADFYISLLTFMKPMQPIMVSVGPEDMAGWFSVEVEPDDPKDGYVVKLTES